MKSNLNVNISLPQSEFAILKKLAKALGWNLLVQQQERSIDIKERKKIIEELYGCIQLPEEFDYKKELEEAISDKYKL